MAPCGRPGSTPGSRVGRAMGRLRGRARRVGEGVRRRRGGEASRRLGRRDPGSRVERRARCHPLVLGKGATGFGGADPGPDRWIGRPGFVQQDGHRGGGFAATCVTGRPRDPLRRSGARDGRYHERHGAARRRSAVRRDVPHLLGLHAPVDQAGRDNGPAGGVRVHARQHRPGRGRAHPPAGRAPHVAPRHPEPHGFATRGRSGDCRSVALRH